MFFHSISVNFDLKVMVQPDEPDKTVSAKDGHHRNVTGALQSPLEILVNSRRAGGVRAIARMDMKVRQQAMDELLQFVEQAVASPGIAGDSDDAPFLSREFRALVQHH